MKASRQRIIFYSLVSILCLFLAALSLPSFIKPRKASQGRRIINDARYIEAAIDQWALDNKKKDGDAIDMNAVAAHLKLPRSDIEIDLCGNKWIIGTVGISNQIKVSAATKKTLADQRIDWGRY